MSRRLKPVQTELALDGQTKPREIVTDSSDDFFQVCGRAKSGEFVVESLAVGKTPAQWVFEVRYKAA